MFVFVFVYIPEIEVFLCPIELWVLCLVEVCLKLNQMFQLAVCRVCLLVASMAVFMAS